MHFFLRLFDTTDFPSRWHCGNWTPEHGWLHIVSDLGVWSAYVAIPCVLGFFILRRKDLPFRSIFLLFGAFILACGTTHLMEAVIFWWPAYRLAGLIKLFTAVVSWSTVFALVPIVPKVLAMRSPEELEREIEARKLAEGALQRANAELEKRVAERTAELTQAVADLQDEQELLRTTLGSIGDGVIATDELGRVTFLNPVAEALTGWNTTDAKDQPLDSVFQVLHEQTRRPIENPASRVLKEGKIVSLSDSPTILIRKDGEERPIDDSAAPIRHGAGPVVGCVLVFRDITERRRAEQERADDEVRIRSVVSQLKDADHRKDEFLAMLAHELRGPLAPLRNLLEVLKRTDGDSDLLQQARSGMERQLAQMVRLVDDLIDVSRITRNRIELRKERIDLESILRQSVEACQPLADAARQQVTVSLPPEPIFLAADPVRLVQVFFNLLNNSCKYTEPGGRILVSAARVGSELAVRIKDNGLGIPPDRLGNIFEMFTQLDKSLERSQGGLGIGLTLAKRLVEMHEGSIEAFSEGPGQGSEFVVRLPVLSDPSKVPSNASAGEAAPATSRRVLVADDNRDSAASLAMLLRLSGHETHVAHDGEEAVRSAETLHPDVILLDIGMPKLSGLDACRRIRELPRGRDMVLVALTGWGQEEDRRKSKEAGFDHHLVKPVDYAALMKLLSQN